MSYTPPSVDELICWVDDPAQVEWDAEVDVAVVGCGGCGLVAALAASQTGASVLVIEKEARAGGNTSLSQGMYPAAGSARQLDAGVDDSPEVMTADILAKNHHQGDPELTRAVAAQSGPLVDWLDRDWGIRLDLVTNFLYPGHSRHRIHAPVTTKGTWLVDRLLEAAGRQENIFIAYNSPVKRLLVSRATGAVLGVEAHIAGQGLSRAAAGAVVLALNGFGANPDMVAHYIPSLAQAAYYGHEGNTGEGILWGQALGAELVNMGAAQGHGSVAHPQGTLLSWAAISLGGYQVNRAGQRFVNENHGYSEHALDVLAQEGGVAVEIFDQRIHDQLKDFEDFQQCAQMGAVKEFATIADLARGFGLDPEALAATHAAFQAAAAGLAPDPLGRQGFQRPLEAPLYGVQVTGALFHTQGGLRVDTEARVLKADGGPIPGLYAGGGTAVGLSGAGVDGYLSANGLLAALTLGRLAGQTAAREASGKDS